MAHAQKPDFVFRRNGRVRLNRQGRQFIRLLAAEVCASAVVMLDTTCSEVVWRVLATHSIRQFHLHFPSRASLCVITFELDSTCGGRCSIAARFSLNNSVFLISCHSSNAFYSFVRILGEWTVGLLEVAVFKYVSRDLRISFMMCNAH